MAITIDMHRDSLRINSGPPPTAWLHFTLFGTADYTEAWMGAYTMTPTTFDPWGAGILFLPRNNFEVNPIGVDKWDIQVNYGITPQTQTTRRSFDLSGGTVHVEHDLVTQGTYPAPGHPSIPSNGLIGPTMDGVTGVDVEVPELTWGISARQPASLITLTYESTLRLLYGNVNSDVFYGRARGECRFMGAYGDDQGDGYYLIQYRFADHPNTTNLTVDEITGIAKEGWWYLHSRKEPVVDPVAHALVMKPVMAYVSQLFDYVDFGLLQLPL